MTPVERAVAHMEARRDDYGHVPVPYRVLLDSIPSELLHAIADERRMVTKEQGCTYEHHWDAVYSAVACPGCSKDDLTMPRSIP